MVNIIYYISKSLISCHISLVYARGKNIYLNSIYILLYVLRGRYNKKIKDLFISASLDEIASPRQSVV